MEYNFFITLGFNVSSSKDVGHPFNMNVLNKYKNIFWSRNVRKDEKTNSTLYYESVTAIDNWVIKNNINPNDVNLCFARGSFTLTTESFISKHLRLLNQSGLRKNIFITKSFGVIDSLKAIKDNPDIKVDLFVGIDGYATVPFRNSVTTKYKDNEIRDDECRIRLNKLPNIDHFYTVVQRKDFIQGFMVGNPKTNSDKVRNYCITDVDIMMHPIYDNYSDGYKRKLFVAHNDMEEIATVCPCVFYNKCYRTLPDLIESYMNKNV